MSAVDEAGLAGLSIDQMVSANAVPFRGGDRWLWAGIAGGMIGTAGLVAGLWVDVTQVFFSWLIAYTWALTIVIGMAAFLMACHTMGATWPTALRRLGEATVAAMPLLALMVIPLLLGLSHLYPWMHPDAVTDPHTRELLRHKLPLMNRPFVVGRSAAYVIVWLVVCSGLRRLSLAMDGPQGRDRSARLQVFSAVLLPALAISGSWAAFDWLMSLSPDWYSTMFGLYVLAGGFLGALALLVILTVDAEIAGRLHGTRPAHHYALGRLLLAFTVFWAYVAYFQFFLIWIADKPIEARWYLDRVHGGYAWVSGFLVFGQFLIPFFALLPYAIKWRGRGLRVIAWWLLFAHYVDVHWLIAPARGASAPVVHWLDAAALLCVGGFTVAFAVWRQRGHALAATSDPRYARALQYHSK
ncbi:MAG TPA: hypothetical protein VGP07_03880 [Polyangia bacterium]|jgi:hypothetical protein